MMEAKSDACLLSRDKAGLINRTEGHEFGGESGRSGCHPDEGELLL
jgi:hypothetical protein